MSLCIWYYSIINTTNGNPRNSGRTFNKQTNNTVQVTKEGIAGNCKYMKAWRLQLNSSFHVTERKPRPQKPFSPLLESILLEMWSIVAALRNKNSILIRFDKSFQSQVAFSTDTSPKTKMRPQSFYEYLPKKHPVTWSHSTWSIVYVLPGRRWRTEELCFLLTVQYI